MNKQIMMFSFLLLSSHAIAAPTIPEVSDMRNLLIKAIDTDQEVIAYLKGDLAEKIKLQTKAPADTKVKARVATVQKIRTGCKRLLVEFSEPSHMMQTTKGTKEPFTMWYQLNLCRDGKPPQISTIGLTEDEIRETN